MHRKFQELLHQYKLEAFKVEHDKRTAEQIANEVVKISEDVLHQNYAYHFHKLPDANRAEIINMINNYTREAILPPVIEKVVERQVTLEKRMDTLVGLIEKMLEALSTEPAVVGAD